MAAYVYRWARRAFLPPLPRFPALRSFSGVAAVALAFMTAGSLTGTPAAPPTPSGSASVTERPTPVPETDEDRQDASTSRSNEGSSRAPSDAATSYDPVVMRDALLDQTVLPDENAGETEPDVWGDEDEALEWG